MNKSSEKPADSGTTGMRSLGQAASNSIGQLRGETGSVVSLTTAEPELPEALEAAAKAGDPKAVDDSLLAAWPATLRQRVEWLTSSEFDRIGVQMVNLVSVPTEDLHTALALTTRCLRPCPQPFVISQLAKCDMVTKARPEHEADTEARSTIFAEDLCEFPADVVAEAFRFWRRTEKWSPTVADIRERCWRLAAVRQSARVKLQAEIRKRRSA